MGNKDNRYKNLNWILKSASAVFLSIILFFISCTNLISEDIKISAIKRDENEKTVNINGVFAYNEKEYVVNHDLVIQPEGESKNKLTEDYVETEKDWLSEFAEKTIDELEKNSEGKELNLPYEKDGVSIQWILPKEDKPVWLLFIGAFMALYFFFSKDDADKRNKKKLKEAFILEIPCMIQQLILILNAGMVTDRALEELINRTKCSNNPLYIELNTLYENSKMDNSFFIGNLYSNALNSGIRDYIRFATMLYENKSRGSELSEKLQAESIMQYENRLLYAKARTKQAETKLCFPLILLLIALIIICIAPAMMKM